MENPLFSHFPFFLNLVQCIYIYFTLNFVVYKATDDQVRKQIQKITVVEVITCIHIGFGRLHQFLLNKKPKYYV
ncbi:hypothetical protein CRP01_21845 [Flavilitoribacter nigricans DSM 23189 = NBRC 102662]|uniref:Uncharacterized protein n=1 Tax=Flavilitoribacter nigricans (strain ATCC 23147 / DSM 23189 / NBRC 102662 / NCIMB 1420 / SS-2) TaxID=1122177 RepID=A0A2D0N7U6_FLAN2|nr:hypothetical protein CRP01_21845 [Flavilitoribacter nigricans DSM 23189 = NBRC 102662]